MVLLCLQALCVLFRHMVCNMVMAVEKGKEELRFAALWLFSYLFLLRLPSEAGSTELAVRTACVRCPCVRHFRAAKQPLMWLSIQNSRP